MNNKYCELILDNIEKEYQNFKEDMLNQSKEYIFQWAYIIHFFNEAYWYFMYSDLLESFSEKELKRLSTEKFLIGEIYGFCKATEEDFISSKEDVVRILSCIYDFFGKYVTELKDEDLIMESENCKYKEGDIIIGLNPEAFTYLKPCFIKRVYSEENKDSLVYYVDIEYIDQTFPFEVETKTIRIDYLDKYYRKIRLE